jgi:hypothetical protein
MGLASAVTLGSKSRRTHDHILLSHLRSQPGGPGPHIIPQEQGGPVIPPGTGLPFLLPLTARRATVEHSNPPPHGSCLCSMCNSCTLHFSITLTKSSESVV